MDKIKLKSNTKKLIVNDFSKRAKPNQQISSEIVCDQVYNLDNNTGKLKSGMGVRSLTTYAENDLNSLHYEIYYQKLGLDHFNKVMHFKQYYESSNKTTHRLLFHGSDNKLYLFEMFANTNIRDIIFLFKNFHFPRFHF